MHALPAVLRSASSTQGGMQRTRWACGAKTASGSADLVAILEGEMHGERTEGECVIQPLDKVDVAGREEVGGQDPEPKRAVEGGE